LKTNIRKKIYPDTTADWFSQRLNTKYQKKILHIPAFYTNRCEIMSMVAAYRQQIKQFCAELLRITARWMVARCKRLPVNIGGMSLGGVAWIALCAVAIGVVDRIGQRIIDDIYFTAPETATDVLWISVALIGVIGVIGLVGIALLVPKVFGYNRDTLSVRELFGESLFSGLKGVASLLFLALVNMVWILLVFGTLRSPSTVIPDGALIGWGIQMVLIMGIVFIFSESIFRSVFVDHEKTTTTPRGELLRRLGW
jgi:hypothetical protein